MTKRKINDKTSNSLSVNCPTQNDRLGSVHTLVVCLRHFVCVYVGGGGGGKQWGGGGEIIPFTDYRWVCGWDLPAMVWPIYNLADHSKGPWISQVPIAHYTYVVQGSRSNKDETLILFQKKSCPHSKQ